MAAENIEVGRLSVPVVADLAPIERQAKTELKRAAERIGKEAGRTISQGLRGDKRATHRAAEQTVADFVDGVKRRARVATADAKEALLRGLIDRKEFEKRGREAGEAANKAILDEIRRRATAGRLRTDDFLHLTDALKVSGRKGGEKFGQEATKGAKGALGDLQKWIAGGLTVGILMAFTGIANRIIRMFQRVATQIRDTLQAGGDARTVRASFESVAGSRGADPTAMLSDLRGALRGTATDMELMRRATFALNAGLPATGQQMGELANIARRLGAAVGRDAADSFQRLAEGIAKGRAQTLQDLGIMTRRNDALRAWEQQTGRNSAALSEQEKVLIHLGAVLEEGRAKVEAMGDEADEAATPVQQLGTFLQNLRDRTAEAVANSGPVVAMLTQIGDAAASSAGEVQNLANHIGAYVATVVELSREHGEGPLRATGRAAAGLAKGVAWWLGLDEMGGIFETFQKNLRAAEIQSETDIVRLKDMQVANLEELVDLQDQEGKAAERRREILRDENKLIAERVRLLTPKPGPTGTPGPTGPTEDQIEAGGAALKSLTASMREFQTAAEMGVTPLRDAMPEVQAAVRELVKATEAVEQAEAQIAAIRAAGQEVPAGAEAYLAHLRDVQAELRTLAESEIARWQQELPLIIRGVEQSVSRLPGYMVQVEGAVRSLDSAVGDLRTQADAVASAERELLHARLAQDPDRIAAAEKQVAAARKALRDMTAALAKALAAAGLPAEKLNELLAEMNALLEGAGMKAEGVAGDESQRDWEGLARTFAAVARGVMSVADAMGILDDNTRRAIQGAIELAEGLGQVASGNTVGGIIQSVGGVVQLIKGLFGSDPQAEARLERHRQAMTSLEVALLKLRDAVLQDVSTQEIERDRGFGEQFLDTVGDRTGWAKVQRLFWRETQDRRDELLADVAREMGLAAANATDEVARAALQKRFEEIDQRYGTNLVQMLAANDVEGIKQAFREMPEIFDDALDKVGSFGDDVAGVIERVAWQFRVLGENDPSAVLAATADALRAAGHSLGEFGDELDELASLDLSTAEGRARRDEIVEAMAEQVLAGGANLGSLSARQWRDLIEQWSSADATGSGLVGSGAETRMNVNQTVAQANEMLRLQSTGVYHLAGIHSLIAQMVSAPPPSFGAIPDLSPPSPASLGLERLSGAMQTIDMGGITVEVALSGLDGITPGNARDVGAGIGAGLGDALTDRLRSAYRGSGASGPARVRVDTRIT